MHHSVGDFHASQCLNLESHKGHKTSLWPISLLRGMFMIKGSSYKLQGSVFIAEGLPAQVVPQNGCISVCCTDLHWNIS